jgi:predicted DNA-binding protein (MmcQ/YjbR family)
MARKQTADDSMLKALRKFGLNYPGAHLKSPWPGHGDLAVNNKTFCYLNVAGQPFAISCKLPQSCDTALMLSFTKPTGYGLGKSGWVSASFPDGKLPPIELLQEWIDESYRAQAPKRLIKQLSAPATAAAKNKPAKNKPAKKRARS